MSQVPMVHKHAMAAVWLRTGKYSQQQSTQSRDNRPCLRVPAPPAEHQWPGTRGSLRRWGLRTHEQKQQRAQAEIEEALQRDDLSHDEHGVPYSRPIEHGTAAGLPGVLTHKQSDQPTRDNCS